MAFFRDAKNVAVNGGTFTTIATAHKPTGMDKLMQAANPNAIYNSSVRYEPPKCHPGTRKAILERIMQWIFGSERDALILWLYGPAGSGKSAILQSIAETCAALNILLSSFFFSRSDETRNHPGSLVATIAYQVSTRIPQITPSLDAAVLRDPMIFEKCLKTQIDILIVGPLKYLIQSGFFAAPKSSPRLILIDGLDECNNDDHRRAVLCAIARAIREHNLPFIFLISSRPEADIRLSFDSSDLANLWDSLVLDDSYTTHSDIRLFLNDSFQSIKATHPMKGHIPPLWPSSSTINTLVTKSSGQFIYASTAIKYVSAIHASPPRQFNTILDVCPPRLGDLPFAEIDALYTYILSSVQDTSLMLDILALLMGCFNTSNISWFLGVDQEDVDIILSRLASLTVRDGYWQVRFSHASLSDFLADKNRSGDFYINKTLYSTKFAQRGIKWLCSQGGVKLELFDAVFTSPRPLKMTEDLYHDLEPLPLDVIWHESQRMAEFDGHKQGRRWLAMFEWLLPKSKFLRTDTANQADIRYQELSVKYALRLKTLIKLDDDFGIKMKNFSALAETLAHKFVLNGTRYNKALTKLLRKAVHPYMSFSTEKISKNSWPYAIFKIIGLSRINAGENPYIHTASRLLRSLKTPTDSLLVESTPHHCCYFHHTRVRHASLNLRHFSDSVYQCRRHWINSGGISRIKRGIHLMKFSSKTRFGWSQSNRSDYDWNCKLITEFLIPILDQCPQSSKLIVLINRHTNRVSLKYTLRRCLMDAVYRYIRRTSEVGKIQ